LPHADWDTEVVVGGAGPAGATIARLLAGHGKRVTLVDPETRPAKRLEIIAPSAHRIIEALNLSPLLEDPTIARPCLGIRRRWGTATTEMDDFFCRPGGQGFVIDRSSFDDRLRARAIEGGAEFVRGRIVVVSRHAGTMIARIETAAGRVTVQADVIVDASGRASTVGRRMGSRRLRSERAVAERHGPVRIQGDSEEPVWLEVQGNELGWSYQILGPCGRHESWTIHRSRMPAGTRSSFFTDASSAYLSPAAGLYWLAIGDAASAFDPITSQGLVNALTTSLVAAGALLSPSGLDEHACRIYSSAVHQTFCNSETGRTAVYDALAARVAMSDD
jgi:flavin-dependent dehydrogenase